MVENAIHGNLELLPLKNAKGAIWTLFGFQSKDGEFVEKDKRKRDVVYCSQLQYIHHHYNILIFQADYVTLQI